MTKVLQNGQKSLVEVLSWMERGRNRMQWEWSCPTHRWASEVGPSVLLGVEEGISEPTAELLG